ncbi:MAG TPA: nuclear transport factor 2 family protein [bacterium]|jgi:hypothetical protein|nr:nuclear transport factor 2 family protein [bacterium]
MFSPTKAESFAQEWIAAWNSHQIDAILAHYAPDVVFTSPFAIRLLNDPSGTIHGLANLKTYFLKGLEAFPDLHFELIEVLGGVNSVTLYYYSVKNLKSAEVMIFNEKGKVSQVLAHYNN